MSDRRSYAISRYINNVDFIPEYVEGEFEIPLIKPEPYMAVKEYVPFNLASQVRNGHEEKGVHFFIHDYLFENLWTKREKYTDMLKRFKVVLTPDFSPYTDWPIMVQRWNHYRKHLLGAWMQEIGCTVYPTVTWTDEKSYAWCFDGEPYGGTVAISSVGMMKKREDRLMFMRGYDKMLEVLEPTAIIFYGQIPIECEGNIIPIDVFTKRLKGVKANGKKCICTGCLEKEQGKVKV